MATPGTDAESRTVDPGTNPAGDGPRLVVPVGDRDHVAGPDSAAVTLVQYGDYECPYCGAAYPEVKAVQAELGDDLRFVFRNFPITGIHPHAQAAAEAAEAAADQGAFWEMHDLLYEHQGALDADSLVGYATELGLDVERFRSDLASGAHADRIHEEKMGGVRSGVNGTPTFFVNGVRFDGPPEREALLEALTDAAARSAGADGE